MRRSGFVFLACLLLLVGVRPVHAQGEGPAISRGLQYLRTVTGPGTDSGEAGLIALAMIKADVPAGDQKLQQLIGSARKRFTGSIYNAGRPGGPDVYEASVIGMALANIDPTAYKSDVTAIARFLAGKQMGNGGWDYANRTVGDCSIGQYAILGLWEAENIGIDVSPRVWDGAASWYLAHQSGSGGWKYHPDESEWGDTISMTAAGVGSLLICKRQLARYRKDGSAGGDVTSSLLAPLVAEGTPTPVRYTPKVTNGSIDVAVQRGIAWLNSHLGATERRVVGPTIYYSLYGIERVGALADKATLGGASWFDRGLQIILSTQQADGHWTAEHGDGPNTAWAILFMTRATEKSVKKLVEIRRLKGGTLLGGRGLPDNVDNLTIAQGRVVVRPMNGAVDQMLTVLADPRTLDADSALAGLIDRYRSEGPKALRPQKDRFRKLLVDKDPGVRRVACWGLGRMGDLDVAPDLIGVLSRDDDDAVIGEAAIGLQVLSRKIDGYGPAPGASAEDRQAAAKKWRAWYDAARPPEGSDADEEATR